MDNCGHSIPFEFNERLWAIGRAPGIGGHCLDVPGVSLPKSGHVAVDEFQNTNAEGVYGWGDVTGQAELTPAKHMH